MTQPDPRYPGGWPPSTAPGPPSAGGQPNPYAPSPVFGGGQPNPYAPSPVFGPTPPPNPGGGYPAGPSLGMPPPGAGPAPSPEYPFGPPSADSHRPEHVVRLPPRPPRRRVWPKVLGVVVTVAVLAGLVLGSYALVRNNPTTHPSAAPTHHAATTPAGTPSPTRQPRDLGSRETDPKPLTLGEVFPTADIKPDPGRDATYHVLKKDTIRTKCPQVATGGVGAVLTKYGCDQAIRATVSAPAKGYVATVGVCNLATAAGAQAADDKITDLGKQTKGSFAGFSAPGDAAKLAASPTVYALQTNGHYLLYVVVGRSDGKAPAGDATTQQIVTDLVQTYLASVIDSRGRGD